MEASTIVYSLRRLGISIVVQGGSLRLEPGSRVPPELVDEVRAHKSKIIAFLSNPRIAEGRPEWHAEEIAYRAKEEGVCIFWSELYDEMIAFVKDESYRRKVPSGIVAYTSQELYQLSQIDPDIETDRLIHEAKKHGGIITSHD